MTTKKNIISQKEIYRKIRKIVPLRSEKVIEPKNTYNRKNKNWKKDIRRSIKCIK